MAHDSAHLFVDELLRHQRRLLGVGHVVDGHQLDLLAEEAALGVVLLDRQLGAVDKVLAHRRRVAGRRRRHADADPVALPAAPGRKRQGGQREDDHETFSHQ